MANEDLLLRQLPHDLDAEQAVLGSMLIDADCVKEIIDKLRPSDFYLRQNQDIFEVIHSMFLQSLPIDGITVCGEMQKAGLFDENTRSYLAQLMDVTPTSVNAPAYAAIVRDKALLRAIAHAASEITAMVQEGIGETDALLEAAEQKIYAIRRGQSAQQMARIQEVLPEVLDRLSEMSEHENHLPGLSTGLSALDQKITGLNNSDLILLAARPGMGKTSMAMNVALNVAKNEGKKVAIFSLEMSREQLVTRLLSTEALVENNRLEAVISMPSGVFKPYAGVSTGVLVFTKTGHGGTDKVWFYDMRADGMSLDDKRVPVTENDIPDIVARFHNLAAEEERARTEKSFLVPKEEIVGNGYDLSINKYKQTEYVPVEYPPTSEIFAELRELEEEIAKGLKELEGMV